MRADPPAPDRANLAKLGEQVRRRLAADPSVYKIPVEGADLYAVGGFLDDGECAKLIGMIDAVARPSQTFDYQGGAYRTSYSGDVDTHDSFVRMIERRLSDLLGIPPAWGETFQGQRYLPEQEFREHHDWFDTTAFYWPAEKKRGGQRSWTAMAWLNAVEEGGETAFPRLGISIPPQPGALLIWNNVCPDGSVNPQTLHAALPVKRGVKHVVTKWFRTRPWT
ncbi:MAG: 2OG-Fe(II) oxygenase [Novosphingobium sp.]|nr:2OG-Fe(II) oxygenase [Novosphingobium sp.]